MYKVEFDTTRGNFIVEVDPSLSPIGAQRFLELVKDNFFTNVPIYRIIPAFCHAIWYIFDQSKNIGMQNNRR